MATYGPQQQLAQPEDVSPTYSNDQVIERAPTAGAVQDAAAASPRRGPAPVDPQVQAPQKQNVFFKSLQHLFGVQTDYVPDRSAPGGMREVPVKQTPGSLFRSILAGAILGGAAGSKQIGPRAGFLPGLAVGGEAAMEHSRAMDQERYNRARQGIAEQQEQEKLDLEKKEVDTRQKLADAQMALTNSEVVKNFQLIQGQSYDLHDKMVKNDAPEVEAYTLAGTKPVVTGLLESEKDKWIKEHPGIGAMRPVATGIVPWTDPQGNKSFQTVFSVYPNKGIDLSQELIDKMNANGMNDMYPGWSTNIKPGTPSAKYDAIQWSTLMQKYYDAIGKNLEKELKETQIKEAKGMIDEHRAQTALAYAQAELAKYGKTKDQQTEMAWTAFDGTKDKDGNYHLENIPDSQKRLLVSSMQPTIDSLGKEIDTLKDQDEKNNINPANDKLLQQRLKEYDDMTHVQKLVVDRLNKSAAALEPKAAPAPPDTPEQASAKIKTVLGVVSHLAPQQQLDQIMQSSSLSDDEKLAAVKQMATSPEFYKAQLKDDFKKGIMSFVDKYGPEQLGTKLYKFLKPPQTI